jgi:hypothetical protein
MCQFRSEYMRLFLDSSVLFRLGEGRPGLVTLCQVRSVQDRLVNVCSIYFSLGLVRSV